MPESLDYCLDQLTQCASSISTLYFKPPGIFHNAIVNNGNTSHADLITRLIRDGDPKEELSLYIIDKEGFPRRKDGKRGVFDYLTEREGNLKRNRRIGLVDEKPIIHVSRDYYLQQHEQDTKRRKTNRDLIFEDPKNEGGVFDVLLRKFVSDEQVKMLLYALQNGSVITDDGSESIGRRKTMFVEDFPIDLILDVLKELVTQWPLGEYQAKYAQLLSTYHEIDSEIQQLKSQIEEQEVQLQSKQPSSTVAKLIEKEKREIEKLQIELLEL